MERRSGRREGLEVVHSSRSSPRREGLATAVRKGRCASREPSSPPEESEREGWGGGVACAGVGQGAPGGDGGWQGGSLPSTPKVHRDSFILLCFFV